MSLLWVTDVDYDARGRTYGDEDRWLVSRLADAFEIVTCHPSRARALMDDHDLVVVRNCGPVAGFADDWAAFRDHAIATGARVYNELSGRGDMLGKAHLVELHRAGWPVIPSAFGDTALADLPAASSYVVKALRGADSHGMSFRTRSELDGLDGDVVVQPRLELVAELSFVFVDGEFSYALTTGSGERWELEELRPDPADVERARSFVEWNAITHGIQRVDFGRTIDGTLLLMELEDLNPYLSLDRLAAGTRDRFVAAFTRALERALEA